MYQLFSQHFDAFLDILNILCFPFCLFLGGLDGGLVKFIRVVIWSWHVLTLKGELKRISKDTSPVNPSEYFVQNVINEFPWGA